jgi:predicted nucleic acid-binding protein
MTMTWFFPDEATAKSEAALDALVSASALVPSLWFLEVTNVLAMAERTKRSNEVTFQAFLKQLGELKLDVDVAAPDAAFARVLPLCRTYKLTSYDATYLELAQRTKLPLATLDKDLRTAAKKLDVDLW